MTKRPRISAIMPTFNRASLALRAVESMLAQTRPPDEIIVVDDGPTDDMEERIRAVGAPLRYVRQENGGASSARNHGLRLATSRWVAFLDSDDLWVDRHLELIERAIVGTSARVLSW